jgi:uncharacterized protein (DUF305 family)
MTRALFSLAVVLVASACAACGSAPAAQKPVVIQPGAPGQDARVLTGAAAAQTIPQATAADVAFMQGMIHHHAQALDMTDLLETRTQDPDMKKLGLRIRVSQTDEIRMMQRWLEARGQDAPDPRAHHDMPGMEGMEHDGMMMPGMLTREEMTRLAGTKGPAFDRLFLEGMIRHHGGALVMVRELFSTPGAGQQSDIFAFASDVEADQQMEIDRMSGMLKERTK